MGSPKYLTAALAMLLSSAAQAESPPNPSGQFPPLKKGSFFNQHYQLCPENLDWDINDCIVYFGQAYVLQGYINDGAKAEARPMFNARIVVEYRTKLVSSAVDAAGPFNTAAGAKTVDGGFQGIEHDARGNTYVVWSFPGTILKVDREGSAVVPCNDDSQIYRFDMKAVKGTPVLIPRSPNATLVSTDAIYVPPRYGGKVLLVAENTKGVTILRSKDVILKVEDLLKKCRVRGQGPPDTLISRNVTSSQTMPSMSSRPHSCEWCQRLLFIRAEAESPRRDRSDRHDARWNKIVFDTSLADLLLVQQKTCAFIDWILDGECIARPDVGECTDNTSGEVYQMDLEELEQFHGQTDRDLDYRLPSLRHAVRNRTDGYVDYVLVAETNPPFRMGGDHTPDVLTVEYFGLWDPRTKLVSYRTVKGLQIYTPHDNPAARDFWTRPIQNDPAYCLPAVKSWLSECEAKHKTCRKLKAQSGPSALRPVRLIYIDPSSAKGSYSLRLQDTEHLGPLPRFAALSYCWGGNQTVKCETSTLEAFTKDIPFAELPRTIQDAVKVCSQLGVRYIWVDALCIIQNEGNEEKILEIAKMPYIYGQASFTIMASRAKTAWEGFLKYRESYTKSKQAFLLSWQSEKGNMGSITLAELETGHEPIDERGWTFQERLLSLRIVEFGSRQTRWSCQEPIPSITGHDKLYGLHVGEGAADGWRKIAEPNDLRQDSFNWSHSLKNPSPWGALVDIYTSRNLSFNTDRALAMSGVAERFSVLTGDEYAAGLWKGNIRDELLWRVEQSERQCRPLVYQGPSWSWFAVNSGVRAYVTLGDGWEIPTLEGDMTDATEVFNTDVLSISAEPVNEKAPYGDVRSDSGRLKLRGRLAVATRINHSAGDSSNDPENVFDITSPQSPQSIVDPGVKLMKTRNISCHLDCLDDLDINPTKTTSGSDGYMALEIKRVCGYSADWTILRLLLRPVEVSQGRSSDGGASAYKRIGIFELELETGFDDLDDDEDFQGEEVCLFDYIPQRVIEIF
ncbi:hypothetical protein CORC01_13454 [Colletotrichum orchidophilum]|uniref:Heterokaryon incompatibility domain-containing protein n=1 Tax=Colletotrichum orchidophilum TaxID=1209926 RepID=A0A1G4AQ15_9PEZI|nr:uncharacterized protein CORC01_13454 [Colletotrichum orchidophilum]OHE91254.1 hypothetical protein CORC01_13454 [Colletotrichum orchidophilum]